MSCGGLSQPQPATPKVRAMASQVRGQLEVEVNQKFSIFDAILFCEQVVAGMNYFVKIQCGDQERDYCHLRIFQDLPSNGGKIELFSYQLDKTRNDPITYF